ncbi:MAG: hypothetical protein J6C50_01685 [Rickettsiales bacterium]|nr:hypothetical protein [Rickettsiales bacterium]
MVRKNIFEILESKYDIEKEFNAINKLFSEPSIVAYMNYDQGQLVPLELAVNSMCFYSWKQRCGCISLADMREKLEIDKRDYSNKNDMIICLEYFCNIIHLANTKLYYNNFLIANSYQKTKEFVMLEKNIELLLEHINYKKVVFNELEKVILVPKNPAATAVAEISSEATSMAILMYNHASLKGQLAEKKDLLRRIAQEYEPLLDKPIDGYTEYFKTSNNMLNNLDIRHNNKAGKKKNALATSLNNEELETWYDELYQLLLFCVLIKDNKDRKDKIAEFLKGLQEKKS